MTTSTQSLASWLTAQIAEDEETAKAAIGCHWNAIGHEVRTTTDDDPRYYKIVGDFPTREHWDSPPIIDNRARDTYRHIARWDPARVLAECEVRRQVVAWHTDTLTIEGEPGEFCLHCSFWTRDGLNDIYEPSPCETLRLLAVPYADREGYREEWAV